MSGEQLGWIAVGIASLSLVIVLVRAWAEHRRWQRFQDTIRVLERRASSEDRPNDT